MSRRILQRILMTADTVGGVWTYAMELCRAFETHGIEVALATMGAPLTASQSHEAAGLRNTEIFASTYKLEWMDSPWADVSAAGDWLLGLEKQVCPDVIHLNGYGHAKLPWQAPKLVVGHSCVLSWWEAVKGTQAGDEWKIYRETVREGLQAADLVVTPSQAMLSSLRDYYGPLENVAVIPNGRDANGQARCRKEHFIFAAGRVWDEAKNISLLASIAPTLNWPVYIAGDLKSPDNTNWVSPTQEGSNCLDADGRGSQFLGRLAPSDVQEWLARAAIYAFPAKYEPFGLSVLEAGLAGCPLVLGDISSLRELWGNAALYILPDDQEGLRHAIERLIADSRLRGQLGHRARTRAAEFSVQRMAASYLKAYSGLLQRRTNPELDLEVACAS